MIKKVLSTIQDKKKHNKEKNIKKTKIVTRNKKTN